MKELRIRHRIFQYVTRRHPTRRGSGEQIASSLRCEANTPERFLLNRISNLKNQRKETRILLWVPAISDVLMAVIALACRGGEELRVPRIYSALRELKGRDALLSGLNFSITGAVCYSRQIEESLRLLMAKGMLIRKGQGTLVVRDDAAEEIRVRLRKKLPASVYRVLNTVSKRFYGKMFETN